MNRFIAFARIGLLGFAAASLSLSTGCGLDVNVGGSTGAGGTGSSGNCSTAAVGGVGGSPDPTGAVSSTSVGAGGSPAVVYCGGNTPFPTPPCAADEYCDYGPDNCGSWDNQGICRKRPDGACPPVFDITCGCDGKAYGSACEAEKAGADVNLYGGCTPPVGQFACGAHFCDQKTEVCIKTTFDFDMSPPSFAPPSLPGATGHRPTHASPA